MVEQIFEYACLIRGAIRRHAHRPALAALDAEHPTEGSAWLVGQYLAQMGCESVAIAKGTRTLDNGTGLTQFWVEADGVAVDIQADRLPASHTSVIITDCSVFHEVFGVFGQVRRVTLNRASLKRRQELVVAFEFLLGQNPALKDPHRLEARAV